MSEMSRPPSSASRTAWLAYGALGVVCLGVLGLSVFSEFVRRAVADDAYMFVRYADNWIAEGRIAWNRGGEPVFGLTSNLFLAVVVPLRLVLESPGLTAKVSSALCGALGLGLMALLGWRSCEASARARALALLVLGLQAVLAVDVWVVHAGSGMSTTFAIAYATTYLLLALRFERSPTRQRALVLGCVGGGAFFARPDLLLYTCAIPAVLFLFAPTPNARRLATWAGVTTALTLGVGLAGAWAYFGNPLPLPFYAKSTGLYGPVMLAAYEGVAESELLGYLYTQRLLIALIAANGLLRLIGRGARLRAFHWGLIGATVIFDLYYRFGVLQIMGYAQRFYFPTLPALVCLAAHALGGLGRDVPQLWRERLFRGPTAAAVAIAFAAMAVAFGPVGRDWAGGVVWATRRPVESANLCQSYCEGRGGWRNYWPLLDRFSGLPDDFSIASTETGMLGAMNPTKRIVDMAGLHTPDFALAEFSAGRLFEHHQPDLLYMPNRNYAQMTRAILANPTFQSDYDTSFQKEDPWFRSFALRRASPHYETMRALAGGGAGALDSDAYEGACRCGS